MKIRIAATVLTTLAVLVVPWHGAGPAGAHTDRVASAAGWLTAELVDHDYGIETTNGGFTFDDWGLTIDFVLALAASGRGADEAATLATDEVAAHAGSYFTGVDFGSPDDRYAGPIGKTLLLATVQGRDLDDFGGWDIEAESRDRMQTTGDQAGRFSDDSGFGDFSNGFGQALNIMGLARTPDGVPAQAMTFLLAQQCDSGGFRLSYETTPGCVEDSEADPDATSFAIQAMLTATASDAVREAIIDAAAWLEVIQHDDGGLGGVGPTAEPNANSTGIGGQALLAVKHADPAAGAHGWIEARQLTSANAGAASDDVGAIAPNAGKQATAEDDGLADPEERSLWRRSTAQGILAIGLPAYSQIGLTIPPPSVDLSDATVRAGDEMTVVGARFAYLEGISVIVDGATAVASGATDNSGGMTLSFEVPSLNAGQHTLTVSGTSSELQADATFTVIVDQQAASTTTTIPTAGGSVDDEDDDGTPSGELPETGRDPFVPGTFGLIIVVYGALLFSLSRLRCESSRSR